jgi:hypothetical protein
MEPDEPVLSRLMRDSWTPKWLWFNRAIQNPTNGNSVFSKFLNDDSAELESLDEIREQDWSAGLRP